MRYAERVTTTLTFVAAIGIDDKSRLIKPKYTESSTHRLTGVRAKYETRVNTVDAKSYRGLDVHVESKQVRKNGTDSAHPVRTEGMWGDEPIPLLEEEWKLLIQRLLSEVSSIVTDPLKTNISDDIIKRASERKLM